MTDTGQRTRRVEFRRRAADANGSRTGAFATVVTRTCRVRPKFGGEAVLAARMAGELPVNIYVPRDSLTRTIDNSFSARDARDTTIVWDIASSALTEDQQWMEILATQRLAGDDDE